MKNTKYKQFEDFKILEVVDESLAWIDFATKTSNGIVWKGGKEKEAEDESRVFVTTREPIPGCC